MSTLCVCCGSDLVQLGRRRRADAEDEMVELRCPECRTVMQLNRSPAEMATLDREQAAARTQIVLAYERLVAESLTLEADTLHEAFARDLLSADDFGRSPRP